MLFRAVTPKAEEFLVPGAFEISCLIVFLSDDDGKIIQCDEHYPGKLL